MKASSEKANVQDILYKTVLGPVISEKATLLTEKARQYTFKVYKSASKPQIKRAVEFLFDVNVEGVQVCNVKGKKKIFKQIHGTRKDWKKAYVKLKEGQSIDLIGSE